MKKKILSAVLALTMVASVSMTSMAAVQDAPIGQEFEMPAYNNGQYPVKNKVEIVTLEEAMALKSDPAISTKNILSKVAEGYEVIVFRSDRSATASGVKMRFLVDGQVVSMGESYRFDYTGFMIKTADVLKTDPNILHQHMYVADGYPLTVTVNGVTYDQGWYIPEPSWDLTILIVPAGHNITIGFRSADVSKAVMHNGAPIGFTGVDDNMGVNVQLRGTNTASAQPQTTGATPMWKQNAKGWWLENADGTYLTNQWYLYNGQWYYMGADGYMLTNTTTPDGYWVNADGVRIE